MKTKHLSRTLSLGLWIAVGTFGCGSSNTNQTNGNSAGAGGGSSSSAATGAGGNTGNGGGTPVGGTTATVGGTGTGTGTTGVTTGGNTGSGDTTGGTSATNATSGTKATGGASAAGGATTATGGKTSAGGTASAGGTQPVGGASSAGGTKATGGSSAAQTGSCTITQKSGAVSTTIGPVGIVTFTVSGVSSLDSAEIKFGLDTTYGLSAPVDVTTAASDYRTLLLGMKTSKAYHYQIVGKSGSTQCSSPDYTITAGGCPTSIKRPTITTSSGVSKSQLDGGFVVLEGYKATTDDYAYILDGDGDVVWCYKPTGFSDLTATRMSSDGKYMWIAHGNVPSGTAHMGRVSMDGAEFKDYSSQFTGLNHDAAVLPNDAGVAYIAYSSGTCDDIKEWSAATNSSKTIINAGKVFTSGACHCNAIKYDSSDDSLIVSEDDHSAYFKVGRDGTVKWVLGGGTFNQFDKSGTGASTWTGEHNLHILGTDSSGLVHLLFFNNGQSATATTMANAVARELTLDLKAMTTKEVWKYASNPGIQNQVMGDVQRLDNGNTLIAYSLVGVIHEVDSTGKLLQTLSWGGGSSGIGYFTKRKTLYGPSPR